MLNGRGAVGAIGLHEVDAGEEFVGGIHALEVFAGDVHEFRQPCAGADEHGFKAVLAHQLVNGDRAADDDVRFHLHAQIDQRVDFLLHNGLGQPELRNAVDQHAAGKVQRFKDGDLIALLGKIARAGQPRRAGADDGDLMPVGGGLFGFFRALRVMGIRHKPLQTADGHRLALDAAHALALALALLRADAAADGGQRAGGGKRFVGLLEVAFGDLMNELGDGDVNGAAADAWHVLAVQAALRLVERLLLRVAQRDFLKVASALVGCLRGHGVLFQRHIRHVSSPP